MCVFRPVFYYRNDALFKVRYQQYKAHFYTWDTPLDAQALVSLATLVLFANIGCIDNGNAVVRII